MSDRITDQCAFTLAETMIGLLLIAFGLLAAASALATSVRSNLANRRAAVAQEVVQRELESLRKLDYSELRMSAATGPITPADVRHPVLLPGVCELLDVANGAGQSFELEVAPMQNPACATDAGAVEPTRNFTIGSGTDAVSGIVYRYITWRDFTCELGVCDGVRDTKRISVAVVLDQAATTPGPKLPLWLSTTVAQRTDVSGYRPPAQSPTGDLARASIEYYLHDNPCVVTAPKAMLTRAAHATHDSASDASACANSGSARPDLMSTEFPPSDYDDAPHLLNGELPPLVRFGTDLDLTGGGYEGGLRMTSAGGYPSAGDCASAPWQYPAAQSSALRRTIHGWSSPKITSPITIERVALSLYASGINDVRTDLNMCAVLLDRPPTGEPAVVAAFAVDRQVGGNGTDITHFDTVYTRPTAYTLAASGAAPHRLQLALVMKDSPATNVALMYGHPVYASSLSLETR